MNMDDDNYQIAQNIYAIWVPNNPATGENVTTLARMIHAYLGLHSSLRPPFPRAQEAQHCIQRLIGIWMSYIIADAVPNNDVMNAGRALQKMFVHTLNQHIMRTDLGVYSP